MLYSVVSLICLAYMLIWLLYLFISVVLKKPSERFLFFKSFKHGKFTLIYPISIPLFWMARYHTTKDFINSFFKAVQDTFSAVLLRLDFDTVKGLVGENDEFAIAYAVCVGTIFLNTLFFVFTVFFEKTVNALRVFSRTFFCRKLNIIVGPLSLNRELIKSIGKGEKLLYLAELSGAEKDWLFAHKVAFQAITSPRTLGKWASVHAPKRRHFRIIVNTGDDARNLLYTDVISEVIAAQGSPEFILENKRGIDVYVFGAQKNCSSFARYVKKTQGRVHYKDRYFMIAYDFESHYPLTEFMTQKQLDYSTATLRDEWDVNVLMVGFGKVNRQLFLSSVANNQFIGVDQKNAPYSRQVHYYIYDKDMADEKNLNHTYYRYETEILSGTIDKSDYFPLPAKPADVQPRKANINDKNFYEKLHQDLLDKQEKHSFNYVIISFGEDLENLDLATKLRDKLVEWDLLKYTYVFLRIRDHELATEVIRDEFGENGHVYCFGDEREAVYDIPHIVNEANERMARHRHYTYTAEKDITRTEEQISVAAAEKWFQSYDETKRRSNLYGCLNLRFKMQLMGYDCIDAAEGVKDASQSYYADYQKNDPIDYSSKKTVNGKKLVTYTNAAIKPGSLRYNLAFQEHARWNAYMITEGYIPAPISSVAAYGGNCVEQRMHCNITTFEGLIAFRKEAAKHEKDPERRNEEAQDVIRYDYHLLDDAGWLTKAGGKVIVSRKKQSATPKA